MKDRTIIFINIQTVDLFERMMHILFTNDWLPRARILLVIHYL